MKSKFILLFLIIQIFLLPIVNYFYDYRKDVIYETKNEQFELNYKSIIKNFDTLALTVFNGFINKNEIKDALSFQERNIILKNHLQIQ